MESSAMDRGSLRELKDRIKGTVLLPGDPGYAEASQPWDPSLKQSPALIVCAGDRDDVVAAVQYAGREGLPVSVINTGHGVAQPADHALLLNVSQLRGVRVDAEAQTAWLEAGATWGDVLAPAQDAGLAPPMGSSTGIGAVGFTLLGGIGWLSRRYGLALDNVISFDLVTAAGESLHVDGESQPDLFWALRGAGPAYGVVTAMEIRLLPVRTVYAGSLVYPPEMVEEVLLHYREWLRICEPIAGDSISSSVLIGNFPMLESLPPILRGRSAVVVRACLTGLAEQGAELLRHWRDWKPPLADHFTEMPFSDVDSISQDPREPLPTFVSNITLRAFTDELVRTLSRHTLAKGKASPLSFTEVRQAGGAIGRVPPESTAFGQRDAGFLLTMVAVARNGVHAGSFAAVTDRVKADIGEQDRCGVYLNFLNGPDKWVLTPDAFPSQAYRRLTGIKHQYDPDNRFRFGLDIPPADTECCEL